MTATDPSAPAQPATPGQALRWAADRLNGVPATLTADTLLRRWAAELDAAPAAPTTVPFDDAAHSVWLHGDWRWLTSKMTIEQREAFADAVDRVCAQHEAVDPGSVRWAATANRWWRDDGPLSTAPPAGTEADDA